MIKYVDNNRAHVKSADKYRDEYKYSIDNNDEFWSEKANRISWIKKWDTVSDVDYNNGKINFMFFGIIFYQIRVINIDHKYIIADISNPRIIVSREAVDFFLFWRPVYCSGNCMFPST